MPTASRRRRVLLILVPSVLIALMLALFAWPSSRLAPRGLPIGVVGDPPALPAGSGAFSIHRYSSEQAARHAIEQRQVYGALVDSSASGRTLFVASAASLFVAQLLQRSFASDRPLVRVVDVVPADPQDPRGAALALSALPLVIIGSSPAPCSGSGSGPGASWPAGSSRRARSQVSSRP